ncbi:helix-turn-helix domain-containing protein [Amycolatopsis sp. cmx-4-68]|uniref:helix-turn-helix domain-containing protein n=1 Tax=Amycolatopsis sp. cmx-4-68 TaxID=2790938 RepID=UPI00397DBE72
MTQDDGGLDGLVRKRIRALRVAQGWSLEELATRARLSPSSLSRIENGQRRLALDQLVTLARALDTSLDQLVETDTDDVIVSPMIDGTHGLMRWPIKAEPGMTVMRQRMTSPPSDNPAGMRAHPGREWLVVLSGTAVLMLGHRRFRVETHQAAEFPTMLPHAIGTAGGPCEILASSTAKPAAGTTPTRPPSRTRTDHDHRGLRGHLRGRQPEQSLSCLMSKTPCI